MQSLVSIGVSIWQMAATSYKKNSYSNEKKHSQHIKAINDSSDDDCSESENDDDSVVTTDGSVIEDANIAMACDDGCVRIYTVSDELIYRKSLPRVSGKITCSPELFISVIIAFSCKKFLCIYLVCRTHFECDLEY